MRVSRLDATRFEKFARSGHRHRFAAFWGALALLSACSSRDNSEDACQDGACASGAGGGRSSGDKAGSHGGKASGTSGDAGAAASSGGSASGGAQGRGGLSSGQGGGSGGTTPVGGASSGGLPGDGGAPAAGGSSGNGGSPASGGSNGAGGSQPVAMYTLVVDLPANNSTVQGKVTVRGRAPGFKNVEVWDQTHTKPPLASATPSADGSFSTIVDTASLAMGATTWTVFAWDSPPGQSFMHDANMPLSLTIGGPPPDPASCDGQTCSGHGACSVTGGKAACTCNLNYHPVGMTCVADSTGNDGAPDPGTAYVPQGYSLKFSDEFSGGSLDTGKWNTLAPWGVQFFSDSHQKQAFIPEAVTLANGLATFTAQKSTGNTGGQPYSSGSLTTNGTFTYGYFETRTRVPAGKGYWPAFWLTSSTRWPPEWDIFEIIDGVIYGYTHPVSGGKCQFVEGAAGGDSTYTLSNVYGAYHVYGFNWTASDIYWYVDGVMTEHYSIDAAAGANDKFWLNISLQVGGDWPGDPNGSTPFPGRMDVDYIRVYQQ